MPATDTILVPFPEWSVRAFLEPRKNQFRAPVEESMIGNKGPEGQWWPVENPEGVDTPFGDEEPVECPYGEPGTEIAVQEAFRLPEKHDGFITEVAIDAGAQNGIYEADGTEFWVEGPEKEEWGRLRPAEEMPEQLVRLRYVIEDVRVERACEIDVGGVTAEGLRTASWYEGPGPTSSHKTSEHREIHLLDRFKRKWTDHYGEDAWTDWCWVVEVSEMGD